MASDAPHTVSVNAQTQLTSMSIALPASSPAGRLLVPFSMVYNGSSNWEYVNLQVRVDGTQAGDFVIERRSVNADGRRRALGGVINGGVITAGVHTVTLHAVDFGAGTGNSATFSFRRMTAMVFPT